MMQHAAIARLLFSLHDEGMAQNNLVGKAIAITGGTRGIGRAIAERLLNDGARVAVCGTSATSLQTALEELAGLGELTGSVADVSKLDDVKAFVSATMARFGRIDAFINNAGVGTFRAAADLTPEEWHQMIGVNLTGVYYCCHEVLPIFKQQGGGDIINISSLAGKNPFAGGAGYNATKFGVNGFSEAAMLDHRNDGVRVSYVMPGSVATEFGRGAADSGADWKIAPEDVADVVHMLLTMPRRTTVSRVEIRPSKPATKKS
ncbi:MAG: short-chain dehydrogenase/reductase [Bryobacterales bacterium]|nr:short-chain dehydrogenase/reductase [Bryobacterales bacterium]